MARMILVVGCLLVVAVALGLGLAFALTAAASAEAGEDSTAEQEQQGGADYEYVPFGATLVNLSGGRLTRYLQVTITLKVKAVSGPAVKARLKSEKAIFTNWMIMYLSDKQLDEVEGGESIRRLQREIQDGFNAILAQGGLALPIEEILFEEFNVQ